MGHLIEAIMELILGSIKNKPEPKPELEYRPEFILKHNTKKIWIRVMLSFIITIGVSTIAYIGNGVPFALLLGIPGFLIFCFSISAFTYRCAVNEEKIERKVLFFGKTVFWKDIICVRIHEYSNDGSKTILLYTVDKKCAIDFLQSLENFWYVVKMAEQKGIEIREEKDLAVKQLSHL